MIVKMGKGVATKTLVEISLAILVIIVVGYFLLGPGVSAMMGLMDYIKEQLGLDIYEQELQKDLFKEALKCSYYRCTRGCLEIDDDDFWRISCKTDFCSSSQWMDDDYKICGWNAVQYPVEVELERDITLSREDDLSRYNCIFPTGGEMGLEDYIINIILRKPREAYEILGFLFGEKIEKNLLLLDDALIDKNKVEKKTCWIGGKNYGNSYEEVGILEGNMYITSDYSEREGTFVRDMEAENTFILAEPAYKIIPYDREKRITFENAGVGGNYRIVVKGEQGDSETYIRFDRIGRDCLDINVGCGLNEESWELCKDNPMSFCGAYILLDYMGKEGDEVSIKIKYTDPKCHDRYPEDSLDCSTLCKSCMKNPRHDLIPNMCCYLKESCGEEGVCENFEPDLKCGESCLEGGAFRCPEECPCTYFGDGEVALCLSESEEVDEDLECGDECNPGDNQCPSECSLCGEFPDGKYRCTENSNIKIYPIAGDFNIIIGEEYTFSAQIVVEGKPIGEDIENLWAIYDEIEGETESILIEEMTLPTVFESDSWVAEEGEYKIQLVVDRKDEVKEGPGEDDNKFEVTVTPVDCNTINSCEDYTDAGFFDPDLSCKGDLCETGNTCTWDSDQNECVG